MKNNKIKRFLSVCTFVLILGFKTNVYAISENFKFVIDTIGIPQYNVYGKEINEEVYKAYNVFSYGWPEELTKSVGQRWKDSKYGLWSKSVGAYMGRGIRGEYNLLGRDYSGNLINNYYFPVDTLPVDTPEYWNYYSNPGAAESWKDKSKYKYVEQLEYMKNTKLLFNDISSKDNSDNPDKIKEYNITALKIGLDKARLDVCSTWKTNGIIHTRRKVGKQIRYAVFLTKPMAASADIKSEINIKKYNYTLDEDSDEIEIEIPYSSKIINMTGYAKKSHIKEIKSELSINGKKVNQISGSKTDSVGTKYRLKLARKDLIENKNNKIKITNSSYAHTEFAADGLMQNGVEIFLNIFVEKKKIIPVHISQTDNIKVVEKSDNNLVVRPLAQYNISDSSNSVGITEAGKVVAIKLDVINSIKSDKINEFEINIDGEKIQEIQVETNSKNDKIVLIVKVPIYMDSTIYGWKSLRDAYGNYFNIDSKDVGKRIREPHNITIKYKYNGEEYQNNIKFDTIDDYITNINYRYGNDIKNALIKEDLYKWLEE